MENKGLRLNTGKAKLMTCGIGFNTIKPSEKYPCSLCRAGVGRNLIFYTSCDAWVHKKCSGIKGYIWLHLLKKSLIENFIFSAVDGRPAEHVSLGD